MSGHYEITGKINGIRYSYPTSDYQLALSKFEANKLKSLWIVDDQGKRKLLRTNKDTK